jgi:hypothetical protein
MKRPDLSERNTTHGLSHLPEYSLWCGMKQRCYYTKHKSYKDYGGRGIKVCDQWLNFENFYADMRSKPEGMTLDRIDHNKDYSPENCKWSTYKEQMRNTNRNNVISFKGKTMCVADWAKELNMSYTKLRMRLHRGWNIERAMS